MSINVNKCLNCGSEDIENYSTSARCLRCGAIIDGDGSLEYDPSAMRDNIDHYDKHHER